jgi:AmmeMemoRadiSam system protein B
MWSQKMKNQARQIVQPPAVAGLFYPAMPDMLQGDVDRLLGEARSGGSPMPSQPPRIKALIVPHAGYTYSGAVAAQAYVRLQHQARRIRRVVIFGPAHRLPFKGLATASADLFSTPLGNITVDKTCRQSLIGGAGPVRILDDAFREEHALEVQLPFLQRVLENFTLVPILVGDADPKEVQNVINQCWGGPETLIIISSDLSHFYDYDTAEQMDRHTTVGIEALRPEDIGYKDACGRIPIQGLLLAARDKGLHVETVARCNSGDTGGDRQSVVGYGAYVFS